MTCCDLVKCQFYVEFDKLKKIILLSFILANSGLFSSPCSYQTVKRNNRVFIFKKELAQWPGILFQTSFSNLHYDQHSLQGF